MEVGTVVPNTSGQGLVRSYVGRHHKKLPVTSAYYFFRVVALILSHSQFCLSPLFEFFSILKGICLIKCLDGAASRNMYSEERRGFAICRGKT
ncbi:hypothetical protein Nepgr_013045 [Nepenthes gracilis]|uniref:Uncharacterized protein n=1 Tax=Nepenthes gracilis TaxID=150966 RepID=A0AAD3XNR6_NEPGR|nr:hypothetical protein Nepgr_013045 [Nepenthes gracilis]